MKPHKDLTNRTFGKLKVEKYLRRESDGKHIWLCRHDCRKANLVKTDAVGNMQNIIKPNCNNDPYIKAIKKFVIRKHPEFGEFNTAKEASDFYQDYLLKQINPQ